MTDQLLALLFVHLILISVFVGLSAFLGKRVIFENQKDCWLTPSEGTPLVFTPALWTHQFGADSFQEFPACIIEGDSDWYGKQQVRSLDGSFIEAATKCGVQVVSGDYTNPDEMKFFVW